MPAWSTWEKLSPACSARELSHTGTVTFFFTDPECSRSRKNGSHTSTKWTTWFSPA